MENLVLVPQRGRLLRLALGSSVLTALSLCAILFPGIQPLLSPVFLRLCGICGVLVFGAATVLSLGQARSPKPRIVLSDEGLFAPVLQTPLIPWSEIIEARLVSTGRIPFIHLTLITEDARYNALPAARKAVVAPDRAAGLGAFSLPISAVDITPEALLEQIQQRIQAFGNPFATAR